MADPDALRRLAEESLGASAESDSTLDGLLHELRVHQVELEIQNEELRRSQAAQERSERRWYELFEASPIPTLALGADGVVQEANAAAVAMFGGRERLIGAGASRLAADSADVLTLGDATRVALRLRSREQRTLRLRSLAGHTSFLAEITLGPVDTPTGPMALLVVRDLSERERSDEERRRLAARIERLQRLDALGRMAGAVAHEINNVLAVVMTAGAEAAERAVGTAIESDLVDVLSAARRGRDLTQKLLGFARVTPAQQQVFDLVGVAEESADFVRRLARGVVQVRVLSPPDPIAVRGDPGQVHRAILNLGLNALDALGEGGGAIDIRVRVLELKPEAAAQHPDVRPGRFACVEVQDDGPGFEPMALEHAFEPFFTTKPPGQGTGLGLAMAWGVARDHHGFATVSSRAGDGAMVSLHFPLSDAAPEAAPVVARRVPSGGGGTALVVDDEPALRRALERMLMRAGWQVIACSSGHEAIEQFKANAADVVLLDLLMPGLSGVQAFERLREIDPAVPIVLMSGYSHERVPADVLAAAGVTFVGKPFEPEELEAAVRRVAQGAPRA